MSKLILQRPERVTIELSHTEPPSFLPGLRTVHCTIENEGVVYEVWGQEIKRKEPKTRDRTLKGIVGS